MITSFLNLKKIKINPINVRNIALFTTFVNMDEAMKIASAIKIDEDKNIASEIKIDEKNKIAEAEKNAKDALEVLLAAEKDLAIKNAKAKLAIKNLYFMKIRASLPDDEKHKYDEACKYMTDMMQNHPW